MRKAKKNMLNLLTSNTFLFWFVIIYILITASMILGYRVKNQYLRAEVAKQEQQIENIQNINNQDKVKLENKDKELKKLQSEKDTLSKQYDQTKLLLDNKKKELNDSLSESKNQQAEAQSQIAELNSKVEQYRKDLIACNEKLIRFMKQK